MPQCIYLFFVCFTFNFFIVYIHFSFYIFVFNIASFFLPFYNISLPILYLYFCDLSYSSLYLDLQSLKFSVFQLKIFFLIVILFLFFISRPNCFYISSYVSIVFHFNELISQFSFPVFNFQFAFIRFLAAFFHNFFLFPISLS